MYVLFITYQSYVILAKVGREDDMCTFNTEKVIHFVWFAMLLIDEFIQVNFYLKFNDNKVS